MKSTIIRRSTISPITNSQVVTRITGNWFVESSNDAPIVENQLLVTKSSIQLTTKAGTNLESK